MTSHVCSMTSHVIVLSLRGILCHLCVLEEFDVYTNTLKISKMICLLQHVRDLSSALYSLHLVDFCLYSFFSDNVTGIRLMFLHFVTY